MKSETHLFFVGEGGEVSADEVIDAMMEKANGRMFVIRDCTPQDIKEHKADWEDGGCDDPKLIRTMEIPLGEQGSGG